MNGTKKIINCNDTEIEFYDFEKLRNVFIEYLRTEIFLNIPKDINNLEIVEWFYRTEPLKKNGIFYEYLGIKAI